MEGVRCVGGVEVCGRGEVCVCVCVEGVEVCGRSKVYGWWEHVYASIVYRCLHMCIVCVVCFVCVRVVCVCVCVLCGMNVCGERCGGVEGVRCVGEDGWM